MLSVKYGKRFLKQFSRLPQNILVILAAKQTIFSVNPFDPRLQTHKLHGKEKEAWAFSLNRSYRIKLIFLTDTTVLFLEIGTHSIYQ